MAKVNFTAGKIAEFTCPADRKQAFLWDLDTRGLGLRATPNGKPAYIFQRQHKGKTVRLTIGSPDDWSIAQARTKAREFAHQIDAGHNPADLRKDDVAAAQAAREQREAERQQQEAEAEAQRQQEEREAIPFAEAWTAYLADRKPNWGARHYADHEAMTSPGGKKTQRGTRGRGKTIAGPLHQFMAMPLRDLTPDVVTAWAAKEAKTRPTVARLALRLLRAFLNWCADHKEYKTVADTAAASNKRAREKLGKPKAKADALLKTQLPAWFAAVRRLNNPVHAAYLQMLLLTGARPSEVLILKWADLDMSRRGIMIRDKVEGDREIPLTPYVAHLLASLPRRGPFMFQSTVDTGKGARPIRKPNQALDTVIADASIDHLTLHGLRRSFGTLAEWLEIPAGVIAQIQGHKPSATAEKHYRVRPLDLLEVHHVRFEEWMLEQAGIPFDPAVEPGKLRAVA